MTCLCYWCASAHLPLASRAGLPGMPAWGEFSPFDLYDCGDYLIRVVPSWA